MKKIRMFLMIVMVVLGSLTAQGCHHQWVQPPAPPGLPPPPPIPVPVPG